MRRFTLGLVLVLTCLAVSQRAYADDISSQNYQILTPTMSSGGYSASTNFSVFSSISEFAHDIAASGGSFSLNPSFIAYPFVSTPAVSATAGNAQVALTWSASQGYIGWSVAGYDVGQSTTSGGPYTYSSVGNVTSSTRTGLSNGTTYYFVVIPTDAFGARVATSTEVSAAPTAGSNNNNNNNGGFIGGGGGSITPSTPTTSETAVTFTGRAYPGSTVTILKDASVVTATRVGETASFTVTVGNLSGGTYLFSVYAEDAAGNQSSTITIPVAVSTGVTTSVSGIFLAPTISLDKSVVKQGNPLRVFGQSIPQSTITISVASENELFFQTPSDKNGVYSYSFLTTPLEMGQHTTHTNASKEGEVSRSSKTIAFAVGTEDVLFAKPKETSIVGDVNKDKKVNLIDFSIEAFWYGKPNPPALYDLNHDGKINLVDLSIMAFHWTG